MSDPTPPTALPSGPVSADVVAAAQALLQRSAGAEDLAITALEATASSIQDVLGALRAASAARRALAEDVPVAVLRLVLQQRDPAGLSGQRP